MGGHLYLFIYLLLFRLAVAVRAKVFGLDVYYYDPYLEVSLRVRFPFSKTLPPGWPRQISRHHSARDPQGASNNYGCYLGELRFEQG